MTATVTDLDASRRHFAEFLATRVLHYVKSRYCAWPFEGEWYTDGPMYSWAKTDHNTKFRIFDQQVILRHLTGAKITRTRYSGMGVPALADAGLAGIGVLDIDTHTTGTVMDVPALAGICDPAAIVTQSSSGRGVHIYFFPPTLVNSYVLRLAMDRYGAYLYGTGLLPADTKMDFFPKKHGSETDELGTRIMAGGSVRFPFAAARRHGYLDFDKSWPLPGDHPGEIFWGGAWIVDFAEKQRLIVQAQQEFLTWLAVWGGPPCLGTILTTGVDQGDRNNLLYDAGYFAAYATHDEAVSFRWVWDRVVPQMRGTTQTQQEVDKTVKSGIDHALDATKPQYVCSTSLCDKSQGRCMRLGEPTQSGYTAGMAASNAAAAQQTEAIVQIISAGGPNALTERDGVLYIGETAIRVEHCKIEDKLHFIVGNSRHKMAPATVMNSTTVNVLSAMMQRQIRLPKGAGRGWLGNLLLLAWRVAVLFQHPMYGQLKTTLYTITTAVGDSVASTAIHEAMQWQRAGLIIDAAMRHYPGTDWQPVISPENAVLGMRLVTPDHDFLTIPPPPTPPTPDTPPDKDDY